MNNNYVSGINEQQLVGIINKINFNIEKLDKRFQQVNEIIYNTNFHYKTESADLFRKKYDDFKMNYDIIKKNLLSYVDDLNNLIIKYKKFETNAADMINSFTPLGVSKEGNII